MCEEKLKKPLTGDEIELRIGMAKYSSGGFSILLYKTARTDRNRLDEAFGVFGWKNKYRHDVNGNIVAQISVWDEVKEQWVMKEDIGVESRTEKEKGQYSDSFKRAGFKWGIGVELYKAPFIWIDWPKNSNNWYGDKKKRPSARVQNWSIELFDNDKGILGGFKILDKYGNVKHTYSPNKKSNKPPTPSKSKSKNKSKSKSNKSTKKKEEPTQKQVELAMKLLKSHVFPEEEKQKIIDRLDNIETKDKYSDAIDWIKTELEDRKAAEKQEKEEANN